MSHRYKKDEQQQPRRPAPGQVEFRLLCTSHAAGGLIGHAGSVIKRLERETTSRIHVDPAVSSSAKDRLVHVIASHSLDRSLHLPDGYSATVSAAQEALVRVFERMLEADLESGGGGGGGGSGKCCLLVGPGMVGAVMGKGGSRIATAVQQTKAYIKVLPPDALPPCADPSDEMILITGDDLAVKKGLVIISRYLQQKTLEMERGAQETTSSRVSDSGLEMNANHTWLNSVGNEGGVEVGFKLLCPYRAAGAVIGTRGRRVKALEEETKASIRFLAAEVGCYERVVTVSALESKELKDSYALNAVIRVFNEIVSSKGRDVVAVRLLILPNQCDWLNNGEVPILSTIQTETGATLRISELDRLPVGATADEKVIQIDGTYPNVQGALFQITWRLRERFFNLKPAQNSLLIPPHKLFNMHRQQNDVSKLTGDMKNCRVSEETNGSLPSMLAQSQLNKGHGLNTTTRSSSDLATAKGGSDLRGSVTVTKTTVEIAVREDVFGGVYGENGSNLERLRLISGATVEVHDPSAGSEGKVIISGTRDQTLVAQSLLQAFLMPAP